VAVEIDELELAGDAVGVAVGHGRQSGWRHVDRLVGVVAHELAHRLTGSD
jgi:Zn-dependent metalloprotease